VGVHWTRGNSSTGTLGRRRRERLRGWYMSAIRGQIHQYLGNTFIVVLIHITFRRNGRSGRRVVDGTDARTQGFRTLTSRRVGVDPERGLTIRRWSVHVHVILILPL
jgi:hypothetical protein